MKHYLKILLFIFWLVCGEPVNVKIFFRAGCFDGDTFSKEIWPTAKIAFDRCTPLQQEYLIWYNPVFGYFKDGTP